MNVNNFNLNHVVDTIQSISPLQQIMQYYHHDVIEKFMDDWRVDEEEAREIFGEMKKFLFLAGKGQQECFNLEIDSPLLIIDKMWHTFILFTEEYSSFCNRFFGAPIHHMPFSEADLKRKMDVVQREGRSFTEAKRAHLSKQFELIVTHLGRETLETWYVEYAEKYSEKNLAMLMKPPINGEIIQPIRTITKDMVAGKSNKAFIKLLTDSYAASSWCGTNCGVYCTCNSNSCA